MPEGYRSPLASDANEGHVALVTGGGTGLGRAVAREYARTGARVAIAGRRPEPLEEVASELAAAGAEVLALPGTDVREPDQVVGLVDAVVERFGRIDVLVNNAGGQFVSPPGGISAKGWRAVHRLNVDAVWDLTRTVAERSMIPGGGGLVVFVGFSPRRGIPMMIHASAARAALENLAGGLAIEWSRHRIRAVCVATGAIDTDAFRAYGDAFVDEATRTAPLGRIASPEEVASVIAFLSTQGGAYITGTTIVVDGGNDAWGLGFPPPQPT
ncbi:MAG TPA: SDR family oxidoreductase [Actinomycetota bacterium]|nr:SDR family oxidoreductase [Actinomycetota bacterium]